jgi:hypothetical protein
VVAVNCWPPVAQRYDNCGPEYMDRESRADHRDASQGRLSMISPIVNFAIQVLMTAQQPRVAAHKPKSEVLPGRNKR